jgi:hypothetical protein
MIRISKTHLASCLSIGCSLSAGLVLISRCTIECDYKSIKASNCNPEYVANALPQDAALALIIVPTFVQLVFQNVPYNITVVSWLISVILITVAVFIADASNSKVMPVYCAAFGILNYEYEKKLIEKYLDTLKQNCQLTLLMRAQSLRVETENQMLELQYLIGNVAHDLRSPMQVYIVFYKCIST